MWELDYKESWAQKNWCFWTVVLEKILERPLDCKEIQPVHPNGIFTGRTDAEAEAPIFWPSDAKSQLIWKDPDAGTDWREKEKVTTEDEMVGWQHQLNGHEFEQTPGDGEGQGSLACCSPRSHKESDTTEWLNKKISLKCELHYNLWPHLLFPFEWHLSSCQMLATHTSRVACAEEKWSKHQVIHWMCSMSRKSTSDSFFFLFDHAMGHARCYSPGQESHQLQCKHRDLTTGLPKKSPASQAFAITGLFVTAA